MNNNNELYHFGILGQKWGSIRRYQNEDGTLTEEGKERYAKSIANKEVNLNSLKNFALSAAGSAAISYNSGPIGMATAALIGGLSGFTMTQLADRLGKNSYYNQRANKIINEIGNLKLT